LKEAEYVENIDILSNKLDKQEKTNESLKQQIENLKRKLANVPGYSYDRNIKTK
jgi:cell division septum initiation protein DivIVA